MSLPLLSGFGFYWLRKQAGFPRAEFARFLKKRKEVSGKSGVASVTSLKDLEAEKEVPMRYIRDLQEFMGAPLFVRTLDALRNRYPKEILEE